jgi:hypothetical protein
MAKTMDISGDLNKFYDQARKDVGKLIAGAKVKGAVIFNASGGNVEFCVYNYIDTVYWIAAQKTLIARDHYGTVAASGVYFKVHPNGHKNQEFLVEPGKAYVYHGPGKIETVTG